MHHQDLDNRASHLPPIVSVAVAALPLFLSATWAVVFAAGTTQTAVHQAFFEATAWVLMPGMLVVVFTLPALFVPRLGLLRTAPLVLAALLFTTVAVLQCTSSRDWEPKHCGRVNVADPLGHQEGCTPRLSVGPEFGWGLLAIFQSVSTFTGR